MTTPDQPPRREVFPSWLQTLIPVGVASGVGAPTVFAIVSQVEGPSALPWSLVALFVILLLTGAIVTLPQHKREIRQVTEITDRMFDQVERLIENDAVIIKALEDIKAGVPARYPPAPGRQGRDRR